MTDAQTEPRKNWFVRHKILSAAGAMIVILIIAVAASGGGRGDKGQQNAADNVVATPTASAGSGETPTADDSQPSSESAKAQPTTTPKTRDNSSAKPTALGAGSFTVGADLPAGRYVITPKAGESGNLSASSKSDPLAINEVLGDAGGLGVPSVTSTLTKGEVVKISGLSQVTFTPADTKLRTTLSAGDWEVGLDIAPGRYVASPSQGDSGNFVVYDKHGLPETNEVLGDAGGLGVPNVTVTLSNGERIRISGLSEVAFGVK